MAREERSIDPEIMTLSGGLFDNAPLRARLDLDDVSIGTELELETRPEENVGWALGPIDLPLVYPDQKVARSWMTDRRVRLFGQVSAAAVAVLFLGVGLAAASQLPWSELRLGPPPAVSGVEEPEPVQPAMRGEGVPCAPPAASQEQAAVVPDAADKSRGVEGLVAAAAVSAGSSRSSELAVLASTGPQRSSLTALATPSRPFSRTAAAIAVAAAARNASGCLPPGDARAHMPVRVVFAPSGRATSAAVLGGPFVASGTGSCIARALQSARVPSFDDNPTAVTTTVHLR